MDKQPNITLTRLSTNDPLMEEKSDREIIMHLAREVKNLKQQLKQLIKDKNQ